MKRSIRQNVLNCIISSLFGASLLYGSPTWAETTVPTEGFTQPLTSDSPIVFDDSLTGAGTLTLRTTDGTRGTAATYGTLQLGASAVLSAFTGTIEFDRATLDLNGQAVSSALTNLNNTASDPADDLVVGQIINTSSNQSVVTLTGAVSQYIPLGQSDGANSNLKLVLDSVDARALHTTSYHTGGTEINNGSVNLYAKDAFGTGGITFNNVTLTLNNGLAYDFSQPVTLNGSGLRIRQTGTTTSDFSKNITGTGDFVISFDSNAVTFSGVAKTYTGKTIIGSMTNAWTGDTRSKATLKIGLADALPTGGTVVFGGNANGTLGGSYLDLNGYNQTVANIQGQGNLINSGTDSSTLTITTPNSATNMVDMNLGKNTTLRLGDGAGVWYVATSGAGTLAAGTATLANTPAQWSKTQLSGSGNTTDSISPSAYVSNPAELDTNSSTVFPNNTTMSFASYIEVMADTDVSFYKNFDDNGYVWLTPINENGTLGAKIVLINNGSSDSETVIASTSGDTGVWDDVVVSHARTLSAGRYLLEVRAGQGGGGVGPTISGSGMGFGIKTGDPITNQADYAQYSRLTIDDSTHKLGGIDTIEVVAPRRTFSSAIAIDAGSTLTLQPGYKGQFVISGNISGDGSALVIDAPTGSVALAGANTYSGGTTINASEIRVGSSAAFGTGDVSVTSPTTFVFDSFVNGDSSKPWTQGSISGSAINMGSPETTTFTAVPTYTGTNPGGNTTWAYTTSVVALEDFTMYFGESYDDAVYLKITDSGTGVSTEILNDGSWNKTTYDSYIFLEGHGYSVEMRVYNGGGGAGPQAQDGWTDTTVGVGASMNAGTVPEGNSYQLLSFNADGTSTLTSNLVAGSRIILANNFTLGDKTAFDCTETPGHVTFNGTISLADSLTLTGSPATAGSKGGFTFNNTISGAGSLVVDTAGTVTLNSVNTYTGGTTLKQGIVALANSSSLGDGAIVSESTTAPAVIQLNPDLTVGWNWAVVANDQGDSNLNSTTNPSSWNITTAPEYLNKSYGDSAQKTVVYQTLLTASQDVSLTFEKGFDDGVLITVADLTVDPTGATKTTVMNNTTWDAVVTGTYEFLQGHDYSLEIRAGNGGSGNGPIPTSYGGSGLGIVAKLTDGVYAAENLYFDPSGNLHGLTGLSDTFNDFTLKNDLVLNGPMTIDGSGLSNETANIQVRGILTGQISGSGKLTLANGTFVLDNPEKNNTFGSLSLQNATYQMGKDSGYVTIESLSAASSVFQFDLTGIDLENFQGIDAWLQITGDGASDNVDFSDVTMVFSSSDLAPEEITKIPLMTGDSAFADELVNITSIFEGDLRGFLSSENGTLYVSLGDSSSIPEPSSWLLLILGASGLASLRKRVK